MRNSVRIWMVVLTVAAIAAGVLGGRLRAASAEKAASASGRYPWQLALTDQRAARFNLADYRGKTLLLGFMFTSCPTACPLQTSKMAKVQAALPAALKQRSQFVSVSIDPRRDTPEKLRTYAQAFGADFAHWRFGVTNDTRALKAVMDRLSVQVREPQNGDFEHKMAIFLIDAAGRVVQQYVGDKFHEARVVQEIQTVDRLFGEVR